MSRNPFSNDEVIALRNNKYVSSVTDFNVSFTHEFKKLTLDNYAKGISVRETLKICEIDPTILGNVRIKNLVSRFRKQQNRYEGFNRVIGSGRRKSLSFNSLEEEIRYLKDKNEYLSQENSFLKKIRAPKKD